MDEDDFDLYEEIPGPASKVSASAGVRSWIVSVCHGVLNDVAVRASHVTCCIDECQ